METGCDIKSGIRSLMPTSRDDRLVINDSDVPILSITAPSEEASEIEYGVGSSESQTPNLEQVDDALTEAKNVVSDVLTLASEILWSKSQDSSTRTEFHEDTSETLVADDVDSDLASYNCNAENKTWSKDAEDRVCPEIRDAANDFVKDVIQEAWHEANRRKGKSKDDPSLENHSERFEIAETLSSSDPDKRRPWYRRARSSARKLLHRLCICGRAHR